MKKLLFIILASVLTSSIISAQANLYIAQSLSRDYAPLTDAQDLDLASNGEDPYVLPIGFEFSIADKTTTQLQFLETGTLHTHTPYSAETASIILANLGLFPRIGTDAQLSFIRYKTEGEEDSRIFKLEFVNFGFHKEVSETQTTESFINYQMWIYEADNSIELLFGESHFPNGPEAVTQTGRPTFGLVNEWYQETETFTDVWAAAGDISNPTIFHATQISDDEAESTLLSSIPATGQGIRIALAATSTQDQYIQPITLYPTLASSTIHYKGESLGNIYHITNINGHTVQKGMLENNTIPVANLNNGIYFITILNNNTILQQGKFIKQ